MKWTYSWLKDYLKTDASPEQIGEKLTEIGLEMERIEYPAQPIAAKIIECTDIPETHLRLLKVDDGTGELRQVVCGAPNARAGMTGVLALPGCRVGDIEIKVGKIRGFESFGMMCSEKELGQGDNHDGIIELTNIAPGTILSKPDAVFDAGITPNRPDYLAVRGIAFDLAAAGMGEFIENKIEKISSSASRKAQIKNPAACPVYRLCEIRGIKMTSSNPVIKTRIAAIGHNPKNAAIDATNYVCYDIGQPMHCFDADEIKGDIVIRNADAGEKFADLFGNDHILESGDLVIADEAGILALAGVVGGARGMTTDNTKNIILESAYFEPGGIRKTAKRLGLATDSSYRFERGINPTITSKALDMAAKIITETCGGEIIGVFSAGENPTETRKIEYSPDFFEKKIGFDLPAERQLEILKKLGFEIDTANDIWKIIPSAARVDITIPEGIVSELIRIYGYDNIKIKPADIKIKTAKSETLDIKVALCKRGLNEIRPYKFGDSKKEILLSDKPIVKVINPIIDSFDTMRNSLVQSLLDTIAGNDRFNRSNLNLFELGAVFDGANPGQQHDQLIIARTGIFGEKAGIKHGRAVEIYDVREDLLALFPGGLVENNDAPAKWAHPFRAGKVSVDGKQLAEFAELHPSVAKKFGIKTRVVIGLVDNSDSIPAQPSATLKFTGRKSSVNSFPDWPLLNRDFAFAMDDKMSPDALIKAIEKIPLVAETNVFDIFDMGDGKKSVAIEVVVQPVSNMSDSELTEFQNTVISECEKLGAKLRS